MSEEMKEMTAEAEAPETAVQAAADPAEEQEIEAGVKIQEEEQAFSASDADKVKAAAIDEMEKASQKALDAMREEDNTESDEIVTEAQEKVSTIFDDLRSWMNENTNPENIKSQMETVSREVAALLEETRKKVLDVAESDQFKQTVEAGKQFITGTGAMIADGLKYGYGKLMEVPELKKAADSFDENMNNFRKSGVAQEIISNAEKGVGDFNKALFGALNKFFAAPEEEKKTPAVPADDADDKK